MKKEAERFLKELKQRLDDDPESDEIIAEYTLHIKDILNEGAAEETDVYEMLVLRLGSPEELAAMWKEEKSVTPGKMQRLFVFLNLGLFIGGGLLIFGHNVLEWHFIELLWDGLTEATTLIIFAYMFFWGLLGYEIGKAFGARGKKILIRTFLICIIPNLILMYLIVFQLIPYEWFDPLLDATFIILCIISTIALFPVSWLGYKWGRKDSI